MLKDQELLHSPVGESKTCAFLNIAPLCFHTFFRGGKCHALQSRDQNMDSYLYHSVDDQDLSKQPGFFYYLF